MGGARSTTHGSLRGPHQRRSPTTATAGCALAGWSCACGPLHRVCVEDYPGALTSSKRRWAAGRSDVWGKARCRAACRVPSTSKTTQCAPLRSHKPPLCAPSRGRVPTSWRKSVRSASRVDWSMAARKRLRVERCGSWLRPNSAMKGGRGQEAIGERFEGRFTAQRIADATAPNDRTDVRARRLYAPPPVSGVLPDIVSCDKNECFCAPRWVI